MDIYDRASAWTIKGSTRKKKVCWRVLEIYKKIQRDFGTLAGWLADWIFMRPMVLRKNVIRVMNVSYFFPFFNHFFELFLFSFFNWLIFQYILYYNLYSIKKISLYFLVACIVCRLFSILLDLITFLPSLENVS